MLFETSGGLCEVEIAPKPLLPRLQSISSRDLCTYIREHIYMNYKGSCLRSELKALGEFLFTGLDEIAPRSERTFRGIKRVLYLLIIDREAAKIAK